jgi:glycosyltransferase involved in cell wall biosynthesis
MGIGGLEKVIFDLCTHTDRSRFDVSVCCLHWKGEFGTILEQMGLKVFVLPDPRERDYFSFMKVARIFRQIQPHIVHTHNTHAFLDGSFAAAITAKPPIIINTDHARQFPDKRRIMLLERLCSGRAGKIVAVSENTRKALISYERIAEEKLAVIHNGIDLDRYAIKVDVDAKKAELGLLNSYPIIGLGARLTPEKGLEYLLESVRLLSPQFPDIKLLIAGKGGMLPRLVGLASKLGIEKHVLFLGPRMDWPEIQVVLDIYTLSSIREGIPLAILEAMAARKAIVATAVGGVPEVITHNETGLLVASRSAQDLADAISRLASDKQLARQFGESAYRRCTRDFSIHSVTRKYESLYDTLIQSEDGR